MIKAVFAFAPHPKGLSFGNGDALPWGHIKQDMAWFRESTMSDFVIMGSKTWESLPCKLDGRTTIVLSSRKPLNKNGDKPDIVRNTSLEKCIDEFRDRGNISVIGGLGLIEAGLEYYDEMHVTSIIPSDERGFETTHFVQDEIVNHLSEHMDLVSCDFVQAPNKRVESITRCIYNRSEKNRPMKTFYDFGVHCGNKTGLVPNFAFKLLGKQPELPFGYSRVIELSEVTRGDIFDVLGFFKDGSSREQRRSVITKVKHLLSNVFGVNPYAYTRFGDSDIHGMRRVIESHNLTEVLGDVVADRNGSVMFKWVGRYCIYTSTLRTWYLLKSDSVFVEGLRFDELTHILFGRETLVVKNKIKLPAHKTRASVTEQITVTDKIDNNIREEIEKEFKSKSRIRVEPEKTFSIKARLFKDSGRFDAAYVQNYLNYSGRVVDTLVGSFLSDGEDQVSEICDFATTINKKFGIDYKSGNWVVRGKMAYMYAGTNRSKIFAWNNISDVEMFDLEPRPTISGGNSEAVFHACELPERYKEHFEQFIS